MLKGNRIFNIMGERVGKKRGFTLVEMLAVFAVVSILLVLALSTQKSVSTRLASAKCLSNLRTVGVGLQMFAADNNGYYPPTSGFIKQAWIQAGWAEFLQQGEYIPDGSVAFCPSIGPKVGKGTNLQDVNPDGAPYSLGHFSYGMRSDHPGKIPPPYEQWKGSWVGFSWNGKASAPIRMGLVASPSKSIVITDSYAIGYSKETAAYRYDAESGAWAGVHFRHGHLANTLFLDGHAKAISREEMADLLTEEDHNAYYWDGSAFKSIRKGN